MGQGLTYKVHSASVYIIYYWIIGKTCWHFVSLLSGHSTPLVDAFTQASADMVDLHISEVFQALRSDDNYFSHMVTWKALGKASTSEK